MRSGWWGQRLELLVLVAFHVLVGGLLRDLFVVLLHRGQVLAGLTELAFLHTLSDIPVDEGTLGVHQVKLVVHASHDLGDGRGVGDHEHGALNPVGHQSTNRIVRLVLTVPMAAFTSLGTTSPRYIIQHAMYFPWRGSHFTIWFAGSNTELEISATDRSSW